MLFPFIREASSSPLEMDHHPSSTADKITICIRKRPINQKEVSWCDNTVISILKAKLLFLLIFTYLCLFVYVVHVILSYFYWFIIFVYIYFFYT